jgi:hypothetical protein
MRRTFFFLVLLLMLCRTSAQQVNSDFWAATDALGRSVGTYSEQHPDKQVILFYWTWNERHDASGTEVKNVSDIVRRYPEAMRDANHPSWKNHPGYFWWEEPLLGYYKSYDRWVLRKHAELLADAKVDAVFFDCTNGSFTWDASTDSLLEVWDQAQRDGVNVPRIGFLLPFGYSDASLKSLRHLYDRLYSKGLYQNLWYYWDGKPCIMAYPDNLTDSPTDLAIRDFFTFRPGQPDYVNGPDPNRPNQWGWLENYPQHGYGRTADGRPELVTVGVAQNACPETGGHCSAFNLPGSYSRSFSQRNGFDPRPEGYLYGWNFDEQWSRAFELDPKAVFVTGWNEWIAGQWLPSSGWTGEPFSFVDEFDWDRSRDLEPVRAWGDRGDVYYMQFVDRVRRFKGIDEQPAPSAPCRIRMGDWKAWEDVRPVYASYRGNTMHRHSQGCCGTPYVNTSGRNDIVEARVARDDEFVYFYVHTDSSLTAASDSHWMMLFIDTDRNKQTGWQGYDYVVNYRSPKGKKVFVSHSRQDKWLWDDCGVGQMWVDDNRLMIRLPRAVLGLKADNALDFEFKWSDNMQDEGNIMDFYVNGDVAPGGRFNYVFCEKK